MSEVVVILAAIITLIIAAAVGGTVLGHVLSRASRSTRRGALLIGILAGIASPILHGLAPTVWVALLGTLAGYARGRFTRRTERREDL